MDKKRIGLYVCYETVEDNDIIEKLKKVVLDHDTWILADIYVDNNFSEKAAFLSLQNDCKEGRLDIVCIKEISHLSHDCQVIVKFIQSMKDIGIFIFISEKNDFVCGDPFSEIMNCIVREMKLNPNYKTIAERIKEKIAENNKLLEKKT